MSKIIVDQPVINEFKPDARKTKFDHKRKIKNVHLGIINFNEECKKDIKNGKGFLITNEEDFDEKTGLKTEDGLYSGKFGISPFDDKITDEYYRCECGDLTGSIHEGEYCPTCGTKVQFINSSLDIFGYIPLGGFSIINPALYSLLCKLIGETELRDIIKFNNKFNVNGKNVSTKSKAKPYNGIGMIAFKKNFDDICEYYRDKRNQPLAYDVIMRYKDSAFTHYIPVYSAILRPLVKDDSKVGLIEDNKSYGIILANANAVRADEESTSSSLDMPATDKTVIIENCLNEIQLEVNAIYKRIIDDILSSKKGIIRGNVTCNRVDYSARCVIIPGIGLSVNEVDMPYAMGVELMRPLIIRELAITKDISERDANTKVDEALRKFDKSIWFIMNYILQKSKNPPQLLVQRSPSLLQESIRLMKIRCIKADMHDHTLAIPTAILTGMNADFDGDTFSCIMIYDNRLKETWEPIHSPKYHFISRHTGLYSELELFIKDSAVTLTELWNVGKNPTYYEHQASDEERSEYINKLNEETPK